MAGIPLQKSYNFAVVEARRYENMMCVEKDCRNYVEQARWLRLEEEDATAVQAYFSNMQAKCSDNRSREAYKEFDDVVIFNTTYLTNKYDMSFVLFVGVNHHGQSILFGCGLVSNENTETFVWLFKKWLQCMNDQAPIGIIIDQDKVMQNTIEIVFQKMKHRWRLWHIMKKLPEKFGYHVDKGEIFSAIHVLVYDSQTVDQFEENWKAMVDRYSLHDNEWLSRMFANRGRWVPCFLKSSFWVRMSTTQRSESMNAFFDGYVHSKTSLKQLVKQYERALRKKVDNEFQADFKSYSQMVTCATKYELEKQFQRVYTISKFREVQDEFIGNVYCDLVSSSEGFLGTTYKFRGIICRHAIAVLIRNNVTALPDSYILWRWKRDVSRAHTKVVVDYDGLSSTPAQLRYDKMCQSFASLAEMAIWNDDQTHDAKGRGQKVGPSKLGEVASIIHAHDQFGKIVFSNTEEHTLVVLTPHTNILSIYYNHPNEHQLHITYCTTQQNTYYTKNFKKKINFADGGRAACAAVLQWAAPLQQQRAVGAAAHTEALLPTARGAGVCRSKKN
ncbi:protein FAR1-RELATED SEQUENCE 5-like [Olea europaea var. sylvestris]|uniref:protein FAR1-RELATED SEQUENCE 5-like n=1 Tax=Olea europaea var. sylvestris TaxID=158386 RepID=UPI000C1CD162|nr:protein FAR1-RELATED SEQUENCE 5-like [Olea europaea var. sylvestris]